jgi:hypothetical protein
LAPWEIVIMKCLNDGLIQAIVDNEATPDARAHAASCATCGARVRERQARSANLASALDIPTVIPPGLESRIVRAVADGATTGATRLRGHAAPAGHWRRTAWSAAAVGAVALAVVLFVVPLAKGPTTVSAAEILARSASRLAQTTTAGIELLEYELVLDGVPREMMPDHADGTYRMSQAIDHNTEGRFRYSSFSPDGRLLSSIAQDPAAGRRVSLLRVDDQYYRFELGMPARNLPSLPEIERLHMQATVAMMQASGQQLLQTIDTSQGPGYRIEVPQVSAANTDAVWDLNHAQVLITASDFRIIELSASGTFLKQPYSLTYRLIARTVVDTAPPDAFVVPEEPGAIVIAGTGTANPTADVFFAALRELARTKGQP